MTLRSRQRRLRESLPELQVYLSDRDRQQFVGLHPLLSHDLAEYNQLEFQHFFLRGVLRADFLAPVQAPTAILDVGCGTGRWCCEVAQRFPQARVTGIDLAPVSLPGPANAQFVQHDLVQGLPFASGSFDFVHARLLGMAIPTQRWPWLVQEYRRVSRQGGWIELFEGGLLFRNVGPRTRLVRNCWERVNQPRGIEPSWMCRLPELLCGSGLRSVQERRLCVPVGAWGDRVGRLLECNLLATWGKLAGECIERLRVSPERFEATLAALPEEWARHRTAYEYVIVYGQV